MCCLVVLLGYYARQHLFIQVAKPPQANPKMTKSLRIIIIDYPNALQSAVQGLKELFFIANQIIKEDGIVRKDPVARKDLIAREDRISRNDQVDMQFTVEVLQPEDVLNSGSRSDLIILPPNLTGNYFNKPSEELLAFLSKSHQHGSILCSACAGAFIIAKTGLLDDRLATTHWQLANQFNQQFPKVSLQIESLLINDGDIISAGGLMSWIDLGLEIVAQFTRPHIMRTLGKYLIVDTGKREQRYYGSFTPIFNHGNQSILQVQHYIQANYNQTLNISELANLTHMSDRTFLRQFTSATTLKPLLYIQKVRVQKACELLESTTQSIELIALSIGYDNASSFRKVFAKLIGLSPSAFRARFV